MSRLSKQLVSLMLLPLISLNGCGLDSETPPDANFNYEPSGEAVYSPVQIPYVIDNPLKITDIQASADPEHQWDYFQISGLANQAVEDSINEAIHLLFLDLVPYATGEKLPRYRGIESAAQPNGRIRSKISVTPHYNCNNVLSVTGKIVETHHYDNNYLYFIMKNSLNFDLSTGNQFLISDVFANDVDGLAIVNDAIVKELSRRRLLAMDYDEYASLLLIAPFKGINHDQKFYLSQDGINVIIDHNNPEFNIGFTSDEILVPFYSRNGHIAITERFYNKDHSIFSEDVTRKRLLRASPASTDYEVESFIRNGAQWNVWIAYPEDLPQSLRKTIDDIRTEQEAQIGLLAQEQATILVRLSIYSQLMGPYVNITSEIYTGDNDKGQWHLSANVYSESGHLIELDDLFREGYDYKTIIKNAINEADLEFDNELNAEVLLDGLTFRPLETGIFFPWQTYEWRSGKKKSLVFSIEYEDIGYENLKVFE